MKFRNLAAAAAALTLTATPVLAETGSANLARTAAPVSESNSFGRGAGSGFLALIAVVLFGLGIYLLINNKNNTPKSP
jgi:hypothetical protein